MKTENKLKLSALAMMMVACLSANAAESGKADTASTARFIDKISAATYGTILWNRIGGEADLGVGLYVQHDTFKNVSLRLSAETGRERFEDYWIDRAWIDAVVSAPLPANSTVKVYGFGGVGYSLGNESVSRVKVEGDGSTGLKTVRERDGEDLLLRAGLGARAGLFKIGKTPVSLFGQGYLWTSTGDRHGAGIAGGLQVGGS